MEIRTIEKGGDKWFNLTENKKTLRSVLFSEETQGDLDADIHIHVIKNITDTLNNEPNGPTLKVKPDGNRKKFTLVQL